MPGHPVGGGGIEAFSGKKGLGRIHGDDAAVKEQGAPVGVFRAELHVMADHDDAHAALCQLCQHLGKDRLEIIIQALGWLVQEQHLRILEQHLGQCHALLLAAG